MDLIDVCKTVSFALSQHSFIPFPCFIQRFITTLRKYCYCCFCFEESVLRVKPFQKFFFQCVPICHHYLGLIQIPIYYSLIDNMIVSEKIQYKVTTKKKRTQSMFELKCTINNEYKTQKKIQ